jgi:hypothetical protein
LDAKALAAYRAALEAAKQDPRDDLSPRVRGRYIKSIEPTTAGKTPATAEATPDELVVIGGHKYTTRTFTFEERKRLAAESLERIKTGTYTPGSYLDVLQRKLLAGDAPW